MLALLLLDGILWSYAPKNKSRIGFDVWLQYVPTFEEKNRGGQSVILKNYAKANNKDLSDYDPAEKTIYNSYLDDNNLCEVSISCK